VSGPPPRLGLYTKYPQFAYYSGLIVCGTECGGEATVQALTIGDSLRNETRVRVAAFSQKGFPFIPNSREIFSSARVKTPQVARGKSPLRCDQARAEVERMPRRAGSFGIPKNMDVLSWHKAL
jgi:hypothetical protein